MKTVIAVVIILAVVVAYKRMSEGKKRFLKELLRQVPYLIPRYYV
jgi:hypothetical protein